jgi:hypothetical protein
MPRPDGTRLISTAAIRPRRALARCQPSFRPSPTGGSALTTGLSSVGMYGASA